jgi:endoglucanase
MKYVETTSYTVALMEIGIRDFPNQMGANAPVSPPIPPGSVSYAGTSGPGAPASSDFTAEAQFGLEWLMKMWSDQTKMRATPVPRREPAAERTRAWIA